MKKSMPKLSVIFFLCLFGVAEATCILPIPDGGDIEPSRPNLEGIIVKISLPMVKIKAKSGLIKYLLLPKNQRINSVFGGDDFQTELKVGQQAYV